jgi:hypothetical protein
VLNEVLSKRVKGKSKNSTQHDQVLIVVKVRYFIVQVIVVLILICFHSRKCFHLQKIHTSFHM